MVDKTMRPYDTPQDASIKADCNLRSASVVVELSTQTTYTMIKLVVLSCVVAAASAVGLWGVAPYPYAAPLLGSNYRGPLSLAPGQPANVLGWDGRPLDTLDVNLDRSAHLVAKAYNGAHILKKRSVTPLIAPIDGHIAVAPAPLIAPSVPFGHISPYYAPYTSFSHFSPYARLAAPYTFGK